MDYNNGQNNRENSQQASSNYNQYQNPPAGVPRRHPKNELCIASMVLGIISLVMFWLVYISVPCAVIGIIFAVIAMKSGRDGKATAGLVTSIISLSALLLLFFLALAFAATWVWVLI